MECLPRNVQNVVEEERMQNKKLENKIQEYQILEKAENLVLMEQGIDVLSFPTFYYRKMKLQKEISYIQNKLQMGDKNGLE